jgi:uncharacterized membrane protein
LLVLFIGAVIVLVDGQLILRSAPAYLAEAYHDPRQAKQVAMMVTLFFHLVMFGVVALVASVGLDPNAGVRSALSRLGVLLLLTAVGHAVTLVGLSRLREQQTGTELAEAQAAQAHADDTAPAAGAGPVPTNNGADAAHRPDAPPRHPANAWGSPPASEPAAPDPRAAPSQRTGLARFLR